MRSPLKNPLGYMTVYGMFVFLILGGQPAPLLWAQEASFPESPSQMIEEKYDPGDTDADVIESAPAEQESVPASLYEMDSESPLSDAAAGEESAQVPSQEEYAEPQSADGQMSDSTESEPVTMPGGDSTETMNPDDTMTGTVTAGGENENENNAPIDLGPGLIDSTAPNTVVINLPSGAFPAPPENATDLEALSFNMNSAMFMIAVERRALEQSISSVQRGERDFPGVINALRTSTGEADTVIEQLNLAPEELGIDMERARALIDRGSEGLALLSAQRAPLDARMTALDELNRRAAAFAQRVLDAARDNIDDAQQVNGLLEDYTAFIGSFDNRILDTRRVLASVNRNIGSASITYNLVQETTAAIDSAVRATLRSRIGPAITELNNAHGILAHEINESVYWAGVLESEFGQPISDLHGWSLQTEHARGDLAGTTQILVRARTLYWFNNEPDVSESLAVLAALNRQLLILGNDIRTLRRNNAAASEYYYSNRQRIT